VFPARNCFGRAGLANILCSFAGRVFRPGFGSSTSAAAIILFPVVFRAARIGRAFETLLLFFRADVLGEGCDFDRRLEG
jgi:hypothetical protein